MHIDDPGLANTNKQILWTENIRNSLKLSHCENETSFCDGAGAMTTSYTCYRFYIPNELLFIAN